MNVALLEILRTYRVKDVTISNNQEWRFAIIRIDVDKIPNDVKFFWDIHSFPFAFFTEEEIPSDAIVDYDKNTLIQYDKTKYREDTVSLYSRMLADIG